MFIRLCKKAIKNSHSVQEKAIYLGNIGKNATTLSYYRSVQRHRRLEEQLAQSLC